MGLEDRARQHIGARDAESKQYGKSLADWQLLQRKRVHEILSEFVKLARDYNAPQSTLFAVVPVVTTSLLGKKRRLDFSFEAAASVYELGKGSGPFQIMTVTEDLNVISAIRIQKPSGESVLAIDNRCARKLPPYSVPQSLDDLQPEDFQRKGLDAHAVSHVALSADAAVMTQVAVGVFPMEPPWIASLVERAAIAIIDRNA